MKKTIPVDSRQTALFILISSISVLIFWVLSQAINVYHVAFTGAVFEILSIPMLIGLLLLPVLSFIQWARQKFNRKSLYLYSFIISIASLLIIFRSFISFFR
jgi:uncharacterized membrane protein